MFFGHWAFYFVAHFGSFQNLFSYTSKVTGREDLSKYLKLHELLLLHEWFFLVLASLHMAELINSAILIRLTPEQRRMC